MTDGVQSPDFRDLRDRGVVVTGAGRGIGRAIAEAFVDAGARVVVADVDAGSAEETAAALGGRAMGMACDVSDEGSVKLLHARAEEALGSVHVLVNNAGVLSVAPVVELSWTEWSRVMAINAGGTFLCSRAFLPGMIAARDGAIVNMSSIAGRRGDPTLAHYSASKFAVIGFTQALAQEVGHVGITVNAVCPGTVATPMVRDLAESWGEDMEAMATRLQIRPGTQRPEQIADAVLFLAKSPAITGQALNVDGGTILS